MTDLQPTEVVASSAALRTEHDELLEIIHDQEESLGRNFVRLAGLVHQVQQTKAWIDWGHKSFNDYLTAIGDQIDRKRGQIYNMLATVRLLPSLSENDLLDLGVTKASVLKDYAKGKNQQPPPQLVDYAKNPATSVEDLRAKVYTATHGEPPEGQKYYKIAYVATPGQQLAIDNMFSLAEKMAEFPADLAEHSKTAAILELAAQECASSWSAANPKQGYGMAALLFQSAYKSFCNFNENAEDIKAFEKELHAAFNEILSGGTYEAQVV